MGRPKKKAEHIAESIEECTTVMADLLVAETDLEILDAEKARAVAEASAKFESPINQARARRDVALAALSGYYYSHLTEIEKGGVKHLALSNGTMGRRDNPPKLKPLNRNWTWTAIQAAVRDKWLGRKGFQAPKAPDMDKEWLKDFALQEPVAAANLGLKAESDETFYAEPARPAEVK